MAPRESPLSRLHGLAGARMVEFAGWRLPVQYSSVAEEVRATRSTAGIFDISHMGNLHLLGQGAAAAAREMVTRDVTVVPAGCSGYALLCNDRGGIIDDLIFMVMSDSAVALVVNAVHHDRDVEWLRQRLSHHLQVELEDLRGNSFGVALQGPWAERILKSTNIQGRLPDCFGTFSQMRLARVDVLVSRTGYTGEDGFELFGRASDAALVWETIVSFGREHGLAPAGLAARDVLRQEMGYPLAGQDIDEQTTPLEAGLRWAIDWNGDFVGRSALEQAKPTRRRLGFVMKEQGVARRGAPIRREGEQIGIVTSGTYSHNLSTAIGQGYVSLASRAGPEDDVEIEVRGSWMRATLKKLPLIPKKTRPGWAAADRSAEK